MFDPGLLDLSRQVAQFLLQRHWTLSTAESCTGGLLAGLLTDIAGSSSYIEQGFVTYSNAAKIAALGVQPDTLREAGAVSEACAREMALGALRVANAEAAISTTGIAGPGGATPGKPVGMVCIGWAWRHSHSLHTQVQTFYFDGDRQAVRHATLRAALQGLLTLPG